MSSGSYPARSIQPWLLFLMMLGLILFLYWPYVFLLFARGVTSCLRAHPVSYHFGDELCQNPSLFDPRSSGPRGLRHPS
jgi:hypothetical protein